MVWNRVHLKNNYLIWQKNAVLIHPWFGLKLPDEFALLFVAEIERDDVEDSPNYFGTHFLMLSQPHCFIQIHEKFSNQNRPSICMYTYTYNVHTYARSTKHWVQNLLRFPHDLFRVLLSYKFIRTIHLIWYQITDNFIFKLHSFLKMHFF